MSDIDLTSMMAPGERRIKHEGKGSEVDRPWQQYLRLSVVMLILFSSISAILLLIGYWSLYAGGWLLIFALLVISQQVGEIRMSGPRVVAILAAVTVAIFWFFSGFSLCRAVWIFPMPNLPLMIKAWIITGILLVVCAPTAWVGYRYATEIVDPSGPTAPRAAVARAGTQWPWTGEIERAPTLNMDDMRQMMERMLSQQPREGLRVEVVEGANGAGDIQVGGSISISDLPMDRETMRQLVTAIDAGHCKWSRRDIVGMGIGDDRARELMRMLVEDAGFLHYPQGRNHPNGAVPTQKGRVFMRGLLM